MKRRSSASDVTIGDKVLIIAVVAVLAWMAVGRYTARRMTMPMPEAVTAQNTAATELPTPAR